MSKAQDLMDVRLCPIISIIYIIYSMLGSACRWSLGSIYIYSL